MKGVILLVLFSNLIYAESFTELTGMVENHNLIKARLNKVNSTLEEARSSGSWGDPQLSLSAVNFPVDSLSRDESMMTGMQIGLSQKLSLSGKYGKLRKAGEEMSKSYLAGAKQLKRDFIRAIWSLGIEKERLVQEEKVLRENLSWIENYLKITKRLYSTGKVPQQAVLDIQMRRSELRAQIEKRSLYQKMMSHQLSSLFGSEKTLDIETNSLPWKKLESWKEATEEENDYQELALNHQLKAKDLKVSAKSRNLIPDVTFGISYTKRNDIDRVGDFVGAKITFPLPTSDKRYGEKNAALHEKLEAQRSLKNYRLSKPHRLKAIEFEIRDLENQLNILRTESLKYAKSSRDITAKSYSRGGADYLELLRAEIQYQNQLLKGIELAKTLKEKKVNYLYINGNELRENKKLAGSMQ